MCLWACVCAGGNIFLILVFILVYIRAHVCLYVFRDVLHQRSLYLVVGGGPPSSWNKFSNSLRYDLLRISLFLLHKRLTNNFVRLRSHCAEAFMRAHNYVGRISNSMKNKGVRFPYSLCIANHQTKN